MAYLNINQLFDDIRLKPANFLYSFLPPEDIQNFVDCFPVYFNEEWNANFKYFLKFIGAGFDYDHPENVGLSFEELILDLDYDPLVIEPEEVHTVKFWRYLTQIVYPELKKDVCLSPREDKIFSFAKAFPIHGPKVVIVVHEPKEEPSFGYAFHKDCVPSTKRILKFLRSEMTIMGNDTKETGISEVEDLLNVDETKFQDKLATCDLQEWIDQGVLLMKSGLNEERNSCWGILTQNIIQILNKFYNNVPFIFVGSETQYYKQFIEEEFHLALNVCHPSWYEKHLPEYSYDNADGETISGEIRNKITDWGTVMPFYTVVKFRFVRTQQVIDWLRIFGDGHDDKIRYKQLEKIYKELYWKKKWSFNFKKWF